MLVLNFKSSYKYTDSGYYNFYSANISNFIIAL